MIKMCLADICLLNMGQSPNSSSYNTTGEGIPFYQGNADFGKVSPKTTTWCTEPKKIAEPGDILLSVRAPIGAINIANEKCCIGRGLVAISPASENIRASYIKQALLASRKILEFLGSGSTFKAIGKKSLGEFLIPVYSLPMQIEIENRFSQVSICIELLRDVLKKLDELVKSRFMEMFGDMQSNVYDWPVKTFEDISEVVTDGEHSTPKRQKNGVCLLSARNIKNHALDLTDVDYIGEEEYRRIAKRIVPQEGDVLISCSGTIGRCCVVPPDVKFQMVRSAALIRFRDFIDPTYAEWLILSDDVQNQINRAATQSSQANLFQGRIKKLRGLIPPLSLQKKFVDFVHQVDKLKFETQQSIEKLQMLYDSLAQEYFAPEGE